MIGDLGPQPIIPRTITLRLTTATFTITITTDDRQQPRTGLSGQTTVPPETDLLGGDWARLP